MASATARASRNHEARKRLDQTLERICRRLDIKLPDEPTRVRDTALEPIVQIEWFADVFEAVENKINNLAVTGEAPADYMSLTAVQLRQLISERGSDEKGSNKKELVAILQRLDSEEESAESDETGDEEPTGDVDGEGDSSEENPSSSSSENDPNGDDSASVQETDEVPSVELPVDEEERSKLEAEYKDLSYGELQIEVSKRSLVAPVDPTPQQLVDLLVNDDLGK